MKKSIIFFSTLILLWSSCQTCMTCEYTYDNNGVPVAVSEELCAEDQEELDAFQDSHELTATQNGTTAVCTKN